MGSIVPLPMISMVSDGRRRWRRGASKLPNMALAAVMQAVRHGSVMLDVLIKAGKTGLAERVWDQRPSIPCAFPSNAGNYGSSDTSGTYCPSSTTTFDNYGSSNARTGPRRPPKLLLPSLGITSCVSIIYSRFACIIDWWGIIIIRAVILRTKIGEGLKEAQRLWVHLS